MKANELRIGNYVYFGKTETKLFCVDLLNIAFEKIKNTKSEIQPIPLTEEWLIKFGFNQDEILNYRYNSEWKLDGKNYDFIYIDIDDKDICINDSWNHRKIKYVHQLQNLYFALTGEELKIKE